MTETLALLTLAESLSPGLTFRRTRRGGNVAAGDGWISFKWIASRRQLRVALLGTVGDYQLRSELPLQKSDASHVAFTLSEASQLEAAQDYMRQAAGRRVGQDQLDALQTETPTTPASASESSQIPLTFGPARCSWQQWRNSCSGFISNNRLALHNIIRCQ